MKQNIENGELDSKAVWEIIVSTGESFWSDGYYSLTEISKSEKPSTKRGYKAIQPEFREEMFEAFRNIVETRERFKKNIEIITTAGNIIPVTASGNLILKDNKPWKLEIVYTIKQSGISKVTQEEKDSDKHIADSPEISIKQKNTADEAAQLLSALDMIHKSGEKLVEYENVIESSSNIIVVINKELKIVLANKRFLEFYKQGRIEIIGKHISEIVGIDDFNQNINPNLQKSFEGESFSKEAIYEEGDKLVYYELSYSPIFNRAGKAEKVVVSGSDITQRKSAELGLIESKEKYKKLTRELARSNQLKELLLDILSHDLRNSAWLINNISDMLAQDEPLNKDYQMLNKATHKLIKILQNTSVLSKISIGEQIEMSQINLTRMIRDVIDEFDQLCEENDVTINFDYNLPLYISANPILEEVFRNYIDNAIKYGGEGGKIEIELIKDDPLTIVKVIDFGETIPENLREVIFEKTVRVDKQTKRGSGLGLSIAKKIAAAHSASVWVEPNSPNGNIFYFSIKTNGDAQIS